MSLNEGTTSPSRAADFSRDLGLDGAAHVDLGLQVEVRRGRLRLGHPPRDRGLELGKVLVGDLALRGFGAPETATCAVPAEAAWRLRACRRTGPRQPPSTSALTIRPPGPEPSSWPARRHALSLDVSRAARLWAGHQRSAGGASVLGLCLGPVLRVLLPAAGGVVGGPAPEEALATAGGGGPLRRQDPQPAAAEAPPESPTSAMTHRSAASPPPAATISISVPATSVS